MWRAHILALAEVYRARDCGFLDVPKDALDDEGFLKASLYGDAFHANKGTVHWFWRRCCKLPLRPLDEEASLMEHPYQSLPGHCFWRRSVAGVAFDQVDPVVSGKFKIDTHDRVATAGSCFAQHIARHLRNSGFDYFVTETANPVVPAAAIEKFNYGVFSARYGNIYTARQLVQTLKRAYCLFSPSEDVWIREDGRLVDPFRPQIQPNGFASEAEYYADRLHHCAAVRKMVEQLDVFVFTLGLTEAWVSSTDGAVFPICPGVAGGTFDDLKYSFANFGVGEVIADLHEAIGFILGT